MDFMRSFWDIIWEVLSWFQICTFIDPWEEGIVVRRGKFSRVIKPGIAWHLPFEIDEINVINIKPAVMELDEQVLTTRDGKKIILSAVLMWSIFDVKKVFLDVEDASDTLADIGVGFIHDLVEESDWDRIRTPRFRDDLKKVIQRTARKFGIKVSTVKFKDLAETRVFRLIN